MYRWITLLFSLTIIFSIANAEVEILGCYEDSADILKRALPYGGTFEESMTNERCVEICADHGYAYSGTEYGKECYCSKQPPTTQKIAPSKCVTPCAGDSSKYCGGVNALSVRHNPDAKEPGDDGHPLVCLAMILKDEAHTIKTTLDSVKPWVDCWYILDTGSKDGTQKLVKELMQGLPGQLFEEPFIDYGASRNRALELSRTLGKPIFTLTLSADETLVNGKDMRDFLQDYRHAFGRYHGAYPVRMDTGMEFDSLRISRTEDAWIYHGRVHEYLAAKDHYSACYRSAKDIKVMFRVTDGERRFNNQYYIRDVLTQEVQKNPKDTRSLLYLARTWADLGNHTMSMQYYKMLAKATTWDEESFHAKVMTAVEHRLSGLPAEERVPILLDAHESFPRNMDALHELAQELFNNGRFELAYIFALRAAQITAPPSVDTYDNVFLRPTMYLYEWEANRLLGFAAAAVQQWQVCVQSFEKVLLKRRDDVVAQQRLDGCRSKLPATTAGTAATPTPTPTPSAATAPAPPPSTATAEQEQEQEKEKEDEQDAAEAIVGEGEEDAQKQHNPTPTPKLVDPRAAFKQQRAQKQQQQQKQKQKQQRAGADGSVPLRGDAVGEEDEGSEAGAGALGGDTDESDQSEWNREHAERAFVLHTTPDKRVHLSLEASLMAVAAGHVLVIALALVCWWCCCWNGGRWGAKLKD